MFKRLDLKGQRFGHLVVTAFANMKHGKATWFVKCDCGSTKEVAGSHLRSGHTQTCGCTKVRDLTMQTFGRLLPLMPYGRTKLGLVKWLCVCSCGNTTVVSSANLQNSTQSCGCWAAEVSGGVVTHGHTINRDLSPTYVSWASMKQRCDNPKAPGYHEWYGGANPPVTYDSAWKDFEPFLAYMGERPEGTTLGRAMDIGNYGPDGNCWWQTDAEQKVEAKKKRLSLQETA